MKTIFFICLIIYSAYSYTCIQNIATNTSYPYVDTFTDNPYCASILTYPVSDDTANQAAARSLQALTYYQTVVTKWKNRASTSDDPTNDCLGVARTFFCTQQFPTCLDSVGDNRPMCDFLCTLWIRRCPEETGFYDQFCSNAASTDCSFSPNVIVNSAFIILALLLSMFIL